MAYDQSRPNRSDSSQNRKVGRSGSYTQRSSNYPGSSGKGSGEAAPPPASNFQRNRSFSKKSNNAQGGQSRASGYGVTSNTDLNFATANRSAPNGSHLRPPAPAPNVQVTGSAVAPTTEQPAQTSAQVVPKVPFQPANFKPDPAPHATPTKAPGDASKSFPIQFGSMSPGTLNGMQIPARTSSAPPNLVEQQRDQAHRDSQRQATPFPIPSVPKQQNPRKDGGAGDEQKGGEAHQVPNPRRDIPASSPVPVSQNQKAPVHNIAGVSMPVPFHQQQVPVQFGGPTSQMQAQGMAGTSLPMPMPMPLPIASGAQLPESVYVSGLHHHPHPMQAQGIIHQGQALNFSAQMGPQMSPHQLGNLGMGPGSQYPQLQPSKLSSTRRPVKITHPETHEELRLENAAGARSNQNMPQAQPVTSVPSARPISYYPNPAFFPTQGPVPLNSTINPSSQPLSRFSFPVSQGLQMASFVNPSHKPPTLDSSHDVTKAVSSVAPASVQVTIKPATVELGEKINDLARSTSSGEKDLSQKHGEASSVMSQRGSDIRPNSALNQAEPPSSVSSASIEEPAPVVYLSTENGKKETITRVDSIEDQGTKQNGKGSSQPSHQASGQSTSVPSLPSQPLDHANSLSSGTSVPSDAIPTALSCSVGSGVESASELVPTDSATGDVLPPKSESSKTSVAKAVDGLAALPHGECIDASHGEPLNNEVTKQDDNYSNTPSESASSKVLEVVSQIEMKSSTAVRISSHEVGTTEIAEKGTQDPMNNSKKDSREVSSAPLVTDADESTLTVTSLELSDGDHNISTPETSVVEIQSLDTSPSVVAKCVISDEGAAPVSITSLGEPILNSEEVGAEDMNASVVTLPAASVKEKPVAALSRSNSSVSRGKKKLKVVLQKADAAGTTADMYMAYKGPEEKKEIIATSESDYTEKVAVDSNRDDVDLSEKVGQGKAEPDDWEDAADISTPKLETADDGKKVSGDQTRPDDDGIGLMAKKYSRDFLLKLSKNCTDLPEGFGITFDVPDALMAPSASRELYPSSGRVLDRSPGGPRKGVVVGDDRWNNKISGPLVSGRDLQMGGPGGNFRPGQGANHVLRNTRGQASFQYAVGILSGPMQSMNSQVGFRRSNSDADRWQRATGFQKGLIPSPQTPALVMHKTEKKYQVGKVTDEEEAKQRQLKAILNKLTPQNFEKLFEQVKAVNIDNAGTLTGVISQIFDKALMEPTFCEMYAHFCHHLAGELPDFIEDNEKITFKRLLLNKCQVEFERGEREQEEADKADAEGEVKQSPEEREEKRVQARRRMLGNIRLIGELYKKKMLTERIMHECIQKLLGQYQNPDEEDIEALCKLMSTIGGMIDYPKAKEYMDAYFDRMSKLSNNMKLSSRVRFMLKDAIDLRKNKWQQRRKVEGPKKIEEVHRDAAQERQVQAGRLARGPGLNLSVRNRQPMDFGSRGSNMLSSPNVQMGGYRGLQSQPRGYGVQDARIDDRHPFESRTLSVQRPIGDEPIMLGPQGGLGRGMSIRGQPSIANIPGNSLSEASSFVDSRRMGPSLNGFGSVSDRLTYGSREDLMSRHNMPERTYDHGAILDRNMSFGNRPSSPNVGGGGLIPMQNVSSKKVWPEERLREMSLSTIKEFYSAKDEREVALCVKELNAPSFYPTMISLWISDSFERKDMERDSLANLLINLSKSQDSLLNHDHLIKGFESVLSTLEEALNDAPKAGEFLGRIFAKIIVEDVIPFPEIGQLIYDGGEEQGGLVEVGLAAEVVGTILEIFKLEKGESFLNEIRTNSGLKLERFRPPNSKKLLRLDKFI